MKKFLFMLSAMLVLFMCTNVVQAVEPYGRFHGSYGNSYCGRVVLNDKLVSTHDASMNLYGGGYGNGYGGGILNIFSLPRGRFVDGAGGGMYRAGGGNGIQGYPYYIYRGPRDFLNPNPPSIGY